jgi:hypothetical protein
MYSSIVAELEKKGVKGATRDEPYNAILFIRHKHKIFTMIFYCQQKSKRVEIIRKSFKASRDSSAGGGFSCDCCFMVQFIPGFY